MKKTVLYIIIFALGVMAGIAICPCAEPTPHECLSVCIDAYESGILDECGKEYDCD